MGFSDATAAASADSSFRLSSFVFKSSNFPPKWCSLHKQILDGPQELMGRAHSPLRGADTMLNTVIVKTVTMGSRLVQDVRIEKGDQSLSDSTTIVGQKQSSRT